MKSTKMTKSLFGMNFRSIAAMGFASACLIFTACEKESVSALNPEQGVNNASSNPSDILTADEANSFLMDYKSFKKNGLSHEKALLDMPLQASVDLMEVVLNASRAVKYQDKDYIKPQYDNLSFTVSASKNLAGMFVPGKEIYEELEKIGSQIDQIALDAQRQFIAIDVEPFRFVDGQLEFTVTVVNAIIIPRYSYNVQELLTYEWKWGSASANGSRWNCEPIPPKFNNIGGACEVASLYIEEYLNPRIKSACEGYYSTRLKTLYLKFIPEYQQYYNNQTKLLYNIPSLQYKCVPPAELRNRYIPELIRAINTEIDAFPNPYRMSYGRNRGVTIGAGSVLQPVEPTGSHVMDVIIDEPQCAPIIKFN